ncbi:MAG TPA: bis(5'-nucleosyl)-tetraphosphatase (symmetrical) YqeK, partial [Dehalococcoidia bacterium]|nr:bis(5'-nucleosyl)-tetraphosphatase (symmetrical) YqeK [Dehalococcoidia bacterium]
MGDAPPALIDLFRERAETLPEWLRAHTARVVTEARRLAQRHELDSERMQAAAWGHDLYRAHSSDDLLRAAVEFEIDATVEERAAPILLHGPIAAAQATRDWGVSDAEILESIRWHTTGRAGMSDVAIGVFVADKIEPDKVADDPGLIPIRALADHDLHAALAALLERRTTQQLARGGVVHPASVEARNQIL